MRQLVWIATRVVFALGFLLAHSAPAAAASCESLASLKLPDATITGATLVPAGPFNPGGPAPAAGGRGNQEVPAFCRVQLTVAPHIKVEVWMPASNWNGRFEGLGGGGYVGAIGYGGMMQAVRAGYATATTDTGHEGADGSFALGRPELIVDFGYRAIHEMTVKAKELIRAFYGTPARYAYFNGCSTGGRQGLAEAQRYPADYDGIISGAPAINWTPAMIGGLWTAFVTKDEASYIPPDKLAAINKASLAACDARDGVTDGLVDDPRACRFDPSVLACREGQTTAECLTMGQVDALKKIYEGPRYPDGKQIYAGREPGTEGIWNNYTTGANLGASRIGFLGVNYLKYFLFNDPNWDFKTWNTARDMKRIDAEQKVRSIMDTFNPDLRAFRDRGGKLLMFHGWGDDAISPGNTIDYFRQVVAVTNGGKAADASKPEDARFRKAAEKTGDFARLFMVPGMGHCFGGPGPATFDALSAMTAWVENKQPPVQLLGSHVTDGAVDMTRPLCPYPMVAKYSGTGAVTDAANFSCREP